MMLPREKAYTYADILARDESERVELIYGYPYMMAPPKRVHQAVSGELFGQFRDYLKGKTCKVYHAPFGVRLFEEAGDSPYDVDTLVEPDISVVCDPAKLDEDGCRGAPDLIIEILSPSTVRHDRLTKFNLYQRAGVREYWIVDPSARTVAVHLLDEGQYGSPDFYTGEAVVPVSVLKGCQIDLNAVFSTE